jgi:hypothetical protein
MAAAKTVAFAETSMTVHVKRASEPGVLPDGTEAWDVESTIMSAGQTLPLSDMPPYLSEAIRKGDVPGLVAVTDAQAKKIANFMKTNMGIGAFVGSEQESDPSFPAEEF